MWRPKPGDKVRIKESENCHAWYNGKHNHPKFKKEKRIFTIHSVSNTHLLEFNEIVGAKYYSSSFELVKNRPTLIIRRKHVG